MKVKLDNVLPNPFRDFDINPIDATRTDALLRAVESDKFWSNLQARKAGRKYELVYGHHRLEVLRALGHKTWEIEVVEIDDNRMFNRMVDENLHQGGNSPMATEEAVVGAKSVLDWHLSNCATVEEWNALQSELYPRIQLEISAGNFASMKANGGVGRKTVAAYLEGRVSKVNVGRVLRMYNPVEVTTPAKTPRKLKTKTDPRSVAQRAAVRTFSNTTNSRAFIDAVNKHKIPTKDIERLAARVKLDGTGRNDIERRVVELVDGNAKWETIQKQKAKVRQQEKKEWKKRWRAKEALDLLSYSRDHLNVTAQLKAEAEKMIPYLENLRLEDEETFFAVVREWQSVVNLLSPVAAGLGNDVAKKIN